MRKHLLLLLLVVACFQAEAQLSLAVSPARIFFDTKSQKRTERLHLENRSKDPSTWLISFQDWDRDSNGKKRFFPPGTMAHSCASRLRAFPTSITIAPGSSGDVNVTLDPGLTLSESDTALTAMIVVTQADDPKALQASKTRQAAIVVKGEFAIHVYAQNNLAKRDLSLMGFRHEVDTNKELQLAVKNTGLVSLDARVRVEVSDKETGKQYNLAEVPCTMLPGALRVCRPKLPENMPKGKYLAVAIVDGGDDLPAKVGELNFELR